MNHETPEDLEAQISRAQECMQNATDPIDRREWQGKFLAAVSRRNAMRTPDQVAQIERERGLR